jgi:hypothetical protein
MNKMVRLAERLEYATANDPARNYCLWDYIPIAPVEDNFRSVNLLYQSFDYADIDDRAYIIVDAIRDAIAPFRTVFGIKLVGESLAWEFYFYDYARKEREVSATRVLRAIAPWVSCDLVVDEHIPYFMASLDLNVDIAAGRRGLDVVNLYIGNPGSTVSSGIAYALRHDGCRLQNFYFFFDAKTQLNMAAEKIVCSAHMDGSRVPIDAILIPELRDCQTICVANKQDHDCIYFSGITVDQFIHFLKHLDYPEPLQSFVAEHRTLLSHLLFDVGLDYRGLGDDLVVLRSGYYGVF